MMSKILLSYILSTIFGSGIYTYVRTYTLGVVHIHSYTHCYGDQRSLAAIDQRSELAGIENCKHCLPYYAHITAVLRHCLSGVNFGPRRL